MYSQAKAYLQRCFLSGARYIETHQKTTIFAGAVACLVLGVGMYLLFFTAGNTHTIVLYEDGFRPSALTITAGDTVVFTSRTGEPFWPASNVHPTHTAYPDFDPRKPVAPNDSWSFKFKEAGTYDFHDHINALYTGVIVVQDASGKTLAVDCSTEKTVQCWERMLLQTLEEEGVKAAFDVMVNLSESEPLFGNDCHGYAHLIGEEAYVLYATDTNFELTPATALCGYGFYHGFMETLLLSTGNIQEARDFCELADKKLAGQASSASTACYHGTGHGAVDGSDPTAWGDIDKMMEPGFELCDKLAQTDLQKYLCNTGVYNATEVISHDPKYGITDLHDDPFVLCNRQTVERREACYSNMVPLLFQKFGTDFEKILTYINENMIDKEVLTIDDFTINEMVTLGTMFEYIRIYSAESDYAQKGIALCRTQPEDDHLACIMGLSGGHLKYGKPNVEYVQALTFCRNDLLTEDERDACYQYMVPRLGGMYNQQKLQQICTEVDQPYRETYCRY